MRTTYIANTSDLFNTHRSSGGQSGKTNCGHFLTLFGW